MRPPTPSINDPLTVNGPNSITISWSTAVGAASYELQFKVGDGSYSSPRTVTSPSYAHSGRSAATEYTYQVRSKNVNGVSDWSTAVSATTSAAAGPGGEVRIPRSLRAVDATVAADPDTTTEAVPGIKLTWSGVSGATSYAIMFWDPGASPKEWADVMLPDPDSSDADVVAAHKDLVDDSTFTVTTAIDPAETYYFIIRAIDDQDSSDWSEPAAGTTVAMAPAPPTDLAASSRGESAIWLTWTASAAADGGAATSYTLRYRRGTSNTLRTISLGNVTEYAHTGLNSNTEYFYSIRAHNSGGNSEWHPDPTGGTDNLPTEESAKTAARQLLPPSGITREAINATDIKLSWSAVTGATGYEIQRWNDADSVWNTLDADEDDDATDASPTTKTTFTDTLTRSGDNTDAMTAYYVIRTLSSGGVTSNYSGVVTGMTKAPEPAAPTLTLFPTGQTIVRLTWTDVAGATGYEVEYAEGVTTGIQFDDARFTKMTKSVSAAQTYYSHTGLKTGTRYTFRVQGTLAHDVKSTWSDVEQIVTRPARADLTATATEFDMVKLTWDGVSLDSSVGGAAETIDGDDYDIQRRLSTTSTWTALMDVSTTTVTNCEVKCEFTDDLGEVTDLVPGGKTYFYRIRVNKDDLGNDVPAVTSYWDQARVRTPSEPDADN